MSTFLRLGEAARQLGVSVDTVRRYIEDGRLPAFRTPGGQTQVRAEDVAALRGLSAVAPSQRRAKRPVEQSEEDDDVAPEREPQPQRPRRPAWKDLPPWERQRSQFKADLEIQQLRQERQRLEDEENRRAAEDLAEAEEDERLQKLKRYGKQCCWDYTIEPVVIRKLEQFVTTDSVPPWLSEFEQRNIVQQFVQKIVDRHNERKRAEEMERFKNMFKRDDG